MHNHIGDRDYYFSSSDEPHWVIAEQDYPDPGSFVVYYDNKTGNFEVTSAESLKGKMLTWVSKRLHTKRSRRACHSIALSLSMARHCARLHRGRFGESTRSGWPCTSLTEKGAAKWSFLVQNAALKQIATGYQSPDFLGPNQVVVCTAS